VLDKQMTAGSTRGAATLFFLTAISIIPRDVNGDATMAQTVAFVAGGGDGADGAPAMKARLQAPFGVNFDRSGIVSDRGIEEFA
jgi:hypothetical protein